VIDPDSFAAGGVPQRRVEHEVLVAASPRDAWDAWVNPSRVVEFLGSEARIDLRIGGRYEILFLLDAPEGQQGAEGCRILAYLPGEMLAFSWNAPPQLPEMRLVQTGFGDGPVWDADVAYFAAAWGRVLGQCRDYFGAA
jgi:uncharacterized protein YndB with AHSA1/START domain